MTVASSPSDAAQVFVDGLAGKGPDAGPIQGHVRDELIARETKDPTEVAIESQRRKFTTKNFRENSSPSATYTVSWTETDAGYDFVVTNTDDPSLEGESFSVQAAGGPYGYLAAFAGLDRSDARKDADFGNATTVLPFTYDGRGGVVITWWSDVDDVDGQVFTCLP